MGKISIISSSSPLSSSSNVDYLINKEATGTTLPFVPTQFKNVGERRGRLLARKYEYPTFMLWKPKTNFGFTGYFAQKQTLQNTNQRRREAEKKIKWRERFARSVAPQRSP